MKNLKNIKKVLNHIKKNPHLWDQSNYHCDPSHCFAGWAEVFATGETVDYTNTIRTARIYFGFSKREADYYFNGARTFKELKTALKPFFDEKGWGRDGFDIEGYDHQGYDSDGYDREGYDIYGYDRFGYDREGYDRYGYNRQCFDRDGYDIDGLDKNNNPKPVNN